MHSGAQGLRSPSAPVGVYWDFTSNLKHGMHTLLTPIDFSQVTPAVLETAEHLARSLGGRIRLLHVIPLGKHAAPYYAAAAAYAEELKADLDKATDKIRQLREDLVTRGVEAEGVSMTPA